MHSQLHCPSAASAGSQLPDQIVPGSYGVQSEEHGGKNGSRSYPIPGQASVKIQAQLQSHHSLPNLLGAHTGVLMLAFTVGLWDMEGEVHCTLSSSLAAGFLSRRFALDFSQTRTIPLAFTSVYKAATPLRGLPGVTFVFH